MTDDALLSVQDLRVSFGPSRAGRSAVDGISFDVLRGQTLALIGGSGAGKSSVVLGVLSLVDPPGVTKARRIAFDGVDLGRLSEAELTSVRGARIGLVPQEPANALDPDHSIGTQVIDVIRSHQDGSARQSKRKAIECLQSVGFPAAPERIDARPSQLSAGMRQRALVAMALANAPDLLILDEPFSQIDALSRAALVAHLEARQAERGTSMLLVTRDADLALEMAHRVVVMYRGYLVETGAAKDVLTEPLHPYTRSLLGFGGPDGATTTSRRLHLIEEHDVGESEVGCRYAGPCELSRAGLAENDRCFRDEPRLVPLPNDRQVRCHFAESGAR